MIEKSNFTILLLLVFGFLQTAPLTAMEADSRPTSPDKSSEWSPLNLSIIVSVELDDYEVRPDTPNYSNLKTWFTERWQKLEELLSVARTIDLTSAGKFRILQELSKFHTQLKLELSVKGYCKDEKAAPFFVKLDALFTACKHL